MTGREVLAEHMTEEQLTRSVVKLARRLGVLVHHCRPAKTDKGWRTPIQGDRGFPDLVLVGRWVVYPELKSERGTLDADQKRWRDRLLAIGADWRVWRPRDWFSGAIREELEALAKGERRG